MTVQSEQIVGHKVRGVWLQPFQVRGDPWVGERDLTVLRRQVSRTPAVLVEGGGVNPEGQTA